MNTYMNNRTLAILTAATLLLAALCIGAAIQLTIEVAGI